MLETHSSESVTQNDEVLPDGWKWSERYRWRLISNGLKLSVMNGRYIIMKERTYQRREWRIDVRCFAHLKVLILVYHIDDFYKYVKAKDQKKYQ